MAETALFNNLPGIYANAEKEGRMLLIKNNGIDEER